jgi:hypothetical protein
MSPDLQFRVAPHHQIATSLDLPCQSNSLPSVDRNQSSAPTAQHAPRQRLQVFRASDMHQRARASPYSREHLYIALRESSQPTTETPTHESTRKLPLDTHASTNAIHHLRALRLQFSLHPLRRNTTQHCILTPIDSLKSWSSLKSSET